MNRWTRPLHEAALAVASGGLIIRIRITHLYSAIGSDTQKRKAEVQPHVAKFLQ